jgi:hypothetical protein
MKERQLQMTTLPDFFRETLSAIRDSHTSLQNQILKSFSFLGVSDEKNIFNKLDSIRDSLREILPKCVI